MPEPSSWSWGAVYKVVVGFCVGATKWQLQPYYPYQSREGDRACVALSGIPKDIRYPCALRPSFLLFSLFYTLRLGKRGGWYGSWGDHLLCGHTDRWEVTGNTYLLKSALKKKVKSARDSWKEIILSDIPFLLVLCGSFSEPPDFSLFLTDLLLHQPSGAGGID